MVISLFVVGVGNQTFAQVESNLVNITDPVVVLETSLGEIVISFFPNDAPNHIQNFISLSQSGFYDGTLFHRIIPGFMIQGGDPNTISGDPNTWGSGGPPESVDAEFSTIKHTRGIVSMARSADLNSAGSQFFIVHKDSNFLDGQYTVFGRIVTEESFETLDKIAAVEIEENDRPADPTQVQIIKTTIVPRSEISNLINMDEPERTELTMTTTTGDQRFESPEHDIGITVPEGWLLQQPEKTHETSPDIVAVGPKVGIVNPVISLTILESNGQTFDDVVSQKLETLQSSIASGELEIISQEEITLHGNSAFVINAEGMFTAADETFHIKFKEILVYDKEKIYSLAYSNGVDYYDSQLSKFDETIDSFEILSQNTADEMTENPDNDEMTENPDNSEKEGCLIATAAYGTELAPQVQFLREIRDNTVLTTQSGMTFMTGFNTLYYSFAPTIADWERENPMFQDAVRIFITPMISSLSIMSLAENGSEIKVLAFGISVIALNLGMYVAAPALIGFQIHKQIKSRK